MLLHLSRCRHRSSRTGFPLHPRPAAQREGAPGVSPLVLLTAPAPAPAARRPHSDPPFHRPLNLVAAMLPRAPPFQHTLARLHRASGAAEARPGRVQGVSEGPHMREQARAERAGAHQAAGGPEAAGPARSVPVAPGARSHGMELPTLFPSTSQVVNPVLHNQAALHLPVVLIVPKPLYI